MRDRHLPLVRRPELRIGRSGLTVVVAATPGGLVGHRSARGAGHPGQPGHRTGDAGAATAGAAATPITAYVINNAGNTVTPIEVATDTPGTAIPVGTAPRGVAVTPDGKTAYITNNGNAGSATVTLIDIATNTRGIQIQVADHPVGVAITPDGTTAYVTNQRINAATPIDVATNTTGTPIPVGDRPIGIAITPLPGAAATTTTLTVFKTPLPLGSGGVVVPTAIVAPPQVTGTVQFKDGTANLGRPVRVIGGRAIGPVTLLTKGPHSLTAVFTPTNPNRVHPSTLEHRYFHVLTGWRYVREWGATRRWVCWTVRARWLLVGREASAARSCSDWSPTGPLWCSISLAALITQPRSNRRHGRQEAAPTASRSIWPLLGLSTS